MSESSSEVDAYIAAFPAEVSQRLAEVRGIIREIAPRATERMAYGMPTYSASKNIVHFAAFKKHVGLYPTSSGIARFEPELAPYRHAKGSIQFPHDQPLPLDLIRRIVQFRADEVAGRP